MTDEAKLHEDKQRGEEAERLLNNPLLVESVARLKQVYIEDWAKTNPEETAARERLHLAYRVVDDVFTHLRAVIGAGKIATSSLDTFKRKR